MRKAVNKKTIILFVAFMAINLIARFFLEPGMTVLFWMLFACQFLVIFLESRNTAALFADYTHAVIKQKVRNYLRKCCRVFDSKAFHEPFIDALRIKMIREGINSIHAGPSFNIA